VSSHGDAERPSTETRAPPGGVLRAGVFVLVVAVDDSLLPGTPLPEGGCSAVIASGRRTIGRAGAGGGRARGRATEGGLGRRGDATNEALGLDQRRSATTRRSRVLRRPLRDGASSGRSARRRPVHSRRLSSRCQRSSAPPDGKAPRQHAGPTARGGEDGPVAAPLRVRFRVAPQDSQIVFQGPRVRRPASTAMARAPSTPPLR